MIEYPNLASFFTVEKSMYPLLDDENSYGDSWGIQRKLDFSTGRYCAHNAMHKLGVKQQAILMSGRLPVWPDGLVGSISHSRNLCGAVAARSDCYHSVGLDIEDVSRFSPSLWNAICTDSELAELENKRPELKQNHAALLFAMKEAFYKFQFPLTSHYLGFKDVNIHFEMEHCRISVQNEKQHAAMIWPALDTYYTFENGSIICLVLWRKD